MLSLTSVSASEVVIGDVADKFKSPCQRVHAVTHGLPSAGFEPMLADAGFESNRVRPLGHHASSLHYTYRLTLWMPVAPATVPSALLPSWSVSDRSLADVPTVDAMLHDVMSVFRVSSHSDWEAAPPAPSAAAPPAPYATNTARLGDTHIQLLPGGLVTYKMVLIIKMVKALLKY